MISLSKDLEGPWEIKRSAIQRDLATLEITLNSYFGLMYGAQTAPTQVAYPLGGSTSIAVRPAVANTFVDVPTALDLRLPVELPPGAAIAIVRLSADTPGVMVTPRLIRTDTGQAVGVGRSVTVVNAASVVTTWPLFTTEEFLVQPVTQVLGQRIYYRLQVSSNVANAAVYACGMLVTAQNWQPTDGDLSTHDLSLAAVGSVVLGPGGGGTGTGTIFTPGSVVFAGAGGVYSQDNPNFFWNDAGNRLGIGTSSPGTTLHVYETGVVTGLTLQNGGTGGGNYILYSTNNGSGLGGNKFSIYDAAAAAARLTIDGSGNVGIGTNAPGTGMKLDVQGKRAMFTPTAESYAIGVRYDVAMGAAASFWFGATNSATPDGVFSRSDGTSVLTLKNTRTVQFNGYGAGTLATDASGNITASDGRLKDIQRPLPYGLPDVLALKPVVFRWKPESDCDTTQEYGGFDARAIAQSMPLAAPYNPASDLYSLDDRALIGTLVHAVQQQQQQIAALEARLEVLEGKG